MELLTDIWDKTTDAMTAVTEQVSDRPGPPLRQFE